MTSLALTVVVVAAFAIVARTAARSRVRSGAATERDVTAAFDAAQLRRLDREKPIATSSEANVEGEDGVGRVLPRPSMRRDRSR